jgi:hypothetical protein
LSTIAGLALVDPFPKIHIPTGNVVKAGTVGAAAQDRSSHHEGRLEEIQSRPIVRPMEQSWLALANFLASRRRDGTRQVLTMKYY